MLPLLHLLAASKPVVVESNAEADAEVEVAEVEWLGIAGSTAACSINMIRTSEAID